jgi:hypothetical protein
LVSLASARCEIREERSDGETKGLRRFFYSKEMLVVRRAGFSGIDGRQSGSLTGFPFLPS